MRRIALPALAVTLAGLTGCSNGEPAPNAPGGGMSETGRPADWSTARDMPGRGLHALIAGIWNPGRTLPSAPAMPATHKCGSCGEDITRQGTAWGVNWVGPAGNGLCGAAPNGVHAPSP